MTIQVGARTRNRAETSPMVIAIPAQVAAGSRMLFVDNLRVFLTILVVLHHLSITYGADGSWFYRERPTTELAGILLTLFNTLNQFYFMGLFFMISGYFVPGAFDRKGGLRFFKDRLVRLGIPLVVYSLLASPMVEFIKAVQNGYFSGSLGQFYINYWRTLKFAPGPLWFVEVLLVFSLVYVVGRAVLDRVRRHAAQSIPSVFHKPITHGFILAFILALAPFSFAVRLLIPMSVEWNHLELAFFPQYILMFTVGILAYRQDWLPDLPGGVRKVWSAIAILALLSLPLVMVFGGAIDNIEPFKGGLTWQSALISTWEAVYCIAMAILLLGLFRRRFDLQGSLQRSVSRNAYTVYIIHPIVIVPLAYFLSGVAIDPLLKFILVAPLEIGLCFLASQYIVRRIPRADQVL
jgi:glucan biosynthesis protein C